MILREPRSEVVQVPQAANEQSGANQEQERQCDLRRHQAFS